jgi:hypothetical protein
MPRIRGVLACLCAGAIVSLLTASTAPAAVRDANRQTYAGGAAAPQPQPQPAPVPVAHASATLAPDGTAVAPAGAPASVRAIIAAGNRIARRPYRYGGGHGSFTSLGYDCSGSVSFALHGARLLAHPLDSTGLASWGARGPGRWVTIYANGGHAFMQVAGLRFDTSGRRGTGSRWQATRASTRGYAVRHVPGL